VLRSVRGYDADTIDIDVEILSGWVVVVSTHLSSGSTLVVFLSSGRYCVRVPISSASACIVFFFLMIWPDVYKRQLTAIANQATVLMGLGKGWPLSKMDIGVPLLAIGCYSQVNPITLTAALLLLVAHYAIIGPGLQAKATREAQKRAAAGIMKNPTVDRITVIDLDPIPYDPKFEKQLGQVMLLVLCVTQVLMMRISA
ncbi:hypothetical protein CP996_26415, partial [Escherichia coli]